MTCFRVALELLLLSFLINFSLSHARLNQEKIIGGAEALPSEIKYVVSLETPRGSICSGGIIGDQLIITAAHCVIDKHTGNFKESRLTALAGSTKAGVDDEGTRVAVETAYVLKEYEPVNPNPGSRYSSTADIAVLRLQEKLGLDTNPLLSKLELPTSDASYVNEEAKIAGYGYDSISVYEDPETHEYNKTSSDKLRYATAKVISNEECKELFFDPIHPPHICAVIIQPDPAVTCGGDSGGPLVYNGNLAIGVLAEGPLNCPLDKWPSVYTRMTKYTTFVKNAMADIRTADMRVHTWMRTK